MALHGWSRGKRSLDQVREALGGRDEERRGWPAARRWVDAIRAGRMFGEHMRPFPTGCSRLYIAEHVVSTLLDLGRPVANSDDAEEQVFVGAGLAA